MDRATASDLLAFIAVARERSFTRAAAKLGMTQSALSQIIRSLEERIGVRLLHRTTRSVTPTQAGERLLLKIGPRFDEIDAELSALSELREKPAGTIRITATEYATQAILLPALAKSLPNYPDIKVDCGAVRCRDSAGRVGGQGHDRGSSWSGSANGRGGLAH